MMKRFFALLCGSILLLSTLAGCGGSETPAPNKNKTTSAFPSSGTTTTATAANGPTRTAAVSTSQGSSPVSATKSPTSRPVATTAAIIPVIQGAPVSATLVPIVFADDALRGGTIAFDIAFDETLSLSQPFTEHIAVLNTRRELQDLYEADQSADKEKNHYLAEYDDAFFEENALIALFIMRSSASYRHTVNTVSKNSGQLYIEIGVKHPEWFTSHPGDFRTFISVKKADIRDVDNIVMYQTEWEE